MSLKKYSFGYGRGTQELELPEERVLQVINGNPAAKIEDVKAATLEAIRNPIGSAPLREQVKKGDKVGIIVSDITRSWIRTGEFLPVIINELNSAGVADEDIFIVVAQGTHRAHTLEEDIAVCSKEVVDRIKIYAHTSTDKENLVYLGTTKRGTPAYVDKRIVDADKVILTGGITVHLMAGFGGGRKSVMPGVSSFETIQKNHALALADVVGEGASKACASTKLDGNRLNEDMCEVAAMLNPCFLVNAVMNADGDFFKIVAGHWYDAWLEGTKDVMKIQGVKVKEKADIVIATPGGFPKDINMYQGSKTYDTASMAMKQGGIMIALLECPDIMEPPAFVESFRFDDMLEFEKAVRAEFTIPFFIAFTVAALAKNNTVYLVTRKENFDIVRKTGQIPVETLAEAWQLAQEELKKRGLSDNYTINLMPHAANTVPMFD
ncbi:MAG TPA: nickel-dependent lactate racemase [Candidatus Avacidaminococcus intestinavium]|uniref:Nickel-dependent lactate racemase n=1 Tax=Candidatus Avacidaminococcus intestinavium TaxID=2840684 RepID=A0A9D1MN64_9FIRM|nr:nickel-dependent lactate racemase [Candidatus Avacidaminococcus intestinavium]